LQDTKIFDIIIIQGDFMSTISLYEETILALRPELTSEDVNDFIEWLETNGDESESLSSAVNRFFGATGECGL
jgi:hypothetical protein